jgi:hypothetical protein
VLLLRGEGLVIEAKACRSCEAPVIWTTTEAGHRMPVDAEPVGAGNIRVVEGAAPEGQPLAVYDTDERRAQPALDDDGVRHVSHFATCEHSPLWRRDRKKGEAS